MKRVSENNMGKLLQAIGNDWGRDSDYYYAVQDALVGDPSIENVRGVLEEYDILEDYEKYLK